MVCATRVQRTLKPGPLGLRHRLAPVNHPSGPPLPVSSSAVAIWAEFESAEPEFASRMRSLMTSRKHLTMATLRRDGSPRISGTEVDLVDGQLRLGSMPRAVKAMDLRRDPRIAIHGPTQAPPSSAPAGWKG